METIKELYWEALRAPDDPVNFRKNPYLRDAFKRRRLGRTRDERLAKQAEIKLYYKCRVRNIKRRESARRNVKDTHSIKQKEEKLENAKERRLLGFIDIEGEKDD